MKTSSPILCCITVVVVALAVVLQLSIAGCTLRCIDALYLSGPEGAFVDEETACLEDQGAAQGFLITSVFTLESNIMATCHACSGSRVHPPLPYREPPEKPPEILPGGVLKAREITTLRSQGG